MSLTLELPYGRGRKREERLEQFAERILKLKEQATQTMTSRGWCYFIEGFNLITKGQFDRTQKIINECRKKGWLPIDFVEIDLKRSWKGVEHPDNVSAAAYLKRWLSGAANAEEYYTPDWWEGEEYYIQMMVEKIDLVNMFEPICRKFHIPIVNAGGWYDISERAVAAKRFKKAEERGLKSVLLYFGDLDPFGLAISDFLLKNFNDIRGGSKWSPANLIIDRFGLNYDFIESQGLTWIDDLESGSGKDMSEMDNRIVQDYIKKYGVRKCEANAVMRASAKPATILLCIDTIQKYLGTDALERFKEKREEIRNAFKEFKEKTGLDKSLEEALKIIEEEENEE